MSRQTFRSAVLLSATAALSCHPGSTETVTEISRFCVQGPSSTLEVEVEFATCLSSSCDMVESAECTLHESEGVVNLEGIAKIYRGEGNCTFDCQDTITHCSLELPPGQYMLQLANKSVTFALPTKHETCSDPG